MTATREQGVLCPLVCEQYISLNDAAFERMSTDAIERLESSKSLDDAKRIYDHDVLPVEMERLRREATRRANELAILFVTVGAQASSPTLAALASPARFVVLVHTIEEKASADSTVRMLGLDATEAALLCIDDGKDSARLYRAVLDEWNSRGHPQQVGVDITGGLKVMSASAAAAAFALPRGNAYYIDTDQLRLHGRVWSVRARRIDLANPFRVFGDIRRATGRELLRKKRYDAAAAVYRELAEAVDEAEDRSRAQLAEAYDALERLDLAEAVKGLECLCNRLDSFALDPRRKDDAVVQQRATVRANAEGAQRLVRLIGIAGKDDPACNLAALRSPDCLEFGEMLLARAEHAAPDVAALLSYRCLELVPQRRLALLGNVDPSKVDWPVLARSLGVSVADLIEKYNAGNKGEEHRLAPNALPLKIASVQSYGLLHVAFPDDVTTAMTVKEFAGAGEARNRSVLAHGLKKLDGATVGKIREKARNLFERLLSVEQVSADDRAALRQRHAFVEVH